jgi:hypothetical protein
MSEWLISELRFIGQINRMKEHIEELKNSNEYLEKLTRTKSFGQLRVEDRNEKLEKALDILISAMTDKKPIPVEFKIAINKASEILYGGKYEQTT